MTSSSADWVSGGRAVDLVGEQDVREDRPGAEPDVPARGVEHRRAGDVRRQQVGRELHASRPPPSARGDGAGQRRLAGAGHVLEQHVTAAEQRGDHQLDDGALAVDGGSTASDDPVVQDPEVRDGAGEVGHADSGSSSTGRDGYGESSARAVRGGRTAAPRP